jgi:hypothetical protein
MEDVMQTRLRRKLKAVGHQTNALDNPERPGIARAQLALGRRGESMGGSVQQAEQHPCSYDKLHVAMVVVVVPLGVLLRLMKSFVNHL